MSPIFDEEPFILRWKPSVMPLFLVKRHMQAISLLQEARVWARVASGAMPLWRNCSME